MLSLTYLFEILDFPHSRQSNIYNCGPSAVQTILQYYGIDMREGEIARELGTNTSGTNPNPIEKFLKSKGLKIISNTMNQNDLKKYTDQNYPILILIQAWSEKKKIDYKNDYSSGHYVVVIGYDSSGFIFEDPSLNNTKGHISFNELDSRWHALSEYNKKIEHWGCVVIGVPKFQSNTIKKIL